LLNDLSWIKEEKIVIYIAGSQHFSADDPDPEKLSALLVLLDETARNWVSVGNDRDHNIAGKELKIAFVPNERLKQLLLNLDIRYDVI
jgi:hypothetical protein